MTAYTLRSVKRIAEVDPVAWDGLANPGWAMAHGGALAHDPGSTPPHAFNPFLSHAFLNALEQAGCATEKTGWQPSHLLVEDPDSRLVGAVPAYLKAHSMGEYVFDHSWADAFERAGGRYYPKLQATVPFTPATGPRLLVADPGVRAVLADGIKAVVRQIGLSSGHVTFATEADLATLEARDFLVRYDQQFHFENRGYGSYDDFLAELASRKRKALKRERRDALQNGITVEWLTGSALTEAHWDAFYDFYVDTGGRKWGRPYLNRAFFSLVSAAMAERILLVLARRDGRPIAGALNFIGSDTLYGRHWGCVEDHPFLHFEVCYHQAIDFAIARKLPIVEAGAQGEHKLARGYLPVVTRSAHFIPDPNFRRAVARFLSEERAAVLAAGEMLTEAGPFRRGDQPDPL